ncbi:MAG: hypothetical protein ACOVN0_04175 [Niveispirillum sp.]|uniref:hypothetical protein n=1 Tax=Niveispirillum sp. TaxID=1917217 RepID=UPI003BA809C7
MNGGRDQGVATAVGAAQNDGRMNCGLLVAATAEPPSIPHPAIIDLSPKEAP